ncbi:hypothetical protein [Curtobacterium sp. B18]|uniref:hypothetical protein n=1 Tax=Curtobacterium sp. B18 TaxID=95614 RepID=UPI0011D20F70|nr:hypothetical protein [Curtobacterium sp. B18]
MSGNGQAFGVGRDKATVRAGHEKRPKVQRPTPKCRPMTDLEKLLIRARPGASEWARGILKAAIRESGREREILEGVAAYEYFVGVRASMMRRIAESIDVFGSVTWLKLIRALNHRVLKLEYFQAEVEALSILQIATNIAGTARATETREQVAIEPRSAMRLARLLEVAYLVEQSEWGIRSATKGVRYITSAEELPTQYQSNSLISILREFDLRNSWRSVERWTTELSRDEVTDPPIYRILNAYSYQDGYLADNAWDSTVALEPKHGFHQFTLRIEEAKGPSRDPLDPGVLEAFERPIEVVATTILGRLMLQKVLEDGLALYPDLTQRGLMTMGMEDLRSDLDAEINKQLVQKWLDSHAQTGQNAERCLQVVKSMYRPLERSYPGPILYEEGENAIVDVAALTWHASVELRINARHGGRLVNIGAKRFEDVTQALIDETSYKPEPTVRDLVQRKLRFNGKDVTDIDAIVQFDRRLFLISCKRTLVGVNYIAGEYREMIAAKSRIEQALDEWADRLAFFKDHPIGDNYDFSDFSLNGLVLVPEMIFTPDARAREITPIGVAGLGVTGLETIDQFASILEMASW